MRIEPNPVQPLIETLESRNLLSVTLGTDGVLAVVGTNKSDNIRIKIDATDNTKLNVTINGQRVQFSLPGISGTSPAITGVKVSGGNGNDVISVVDTKDADGALLAMVPVTMFGGNGKDVLTGGNEDDELHGGNSNDILNGGAGDDVLYGDNGKDLLNGGDGNDTLFGGLGNDILNGGDGNDSLSGGAQKDKVKGGKGSDTFNPNEKKDEVLDRGPKDKAVSGHK